MKSRIESNTIIAFGYEKAEQLRKQQRIRTAETYETSIRSFHRFCKGKDLQLKRINSTVISQYQTWLRSNDKMPGTVSFYLRTLKAIYNKAVNEKIVRDRKPFKEAFTIIPETAKRALSLSELLLLKKYKGSSRQTTLIWARDMFIMSFYMRGISLIDLAFLKKSDLHGDQIEYRRRKTGKLITLKWTVEMEILARKYRNEESPFIFPIIAHPCRPLNSFRAASQKINRSLHNLAKILGIRSGFLTFYCARHTWASLARDKGIPVNIISFALGHSNEAVTQVYLSELDRSVIDKANARLIHMLG